MTLQRIVLGLVAWVVLACVLAPLMGRVLRNRALELEAVEVWSKLPKLDQPDRNDRTPISFQRSQEWGQ